MDKHQRSGWIPIKDFYSMARSYEWLGLGVNNQSKHGGVTSETKISTYKHLSKTESKICSNVNEIIEKITVEENLLLDFVTATGWKPDGPNLYPLYQLHLTPLIKQRFTWKYCNDQRKPNQP